MKKAMLIKSPLTQTNKSEVLIIKKSLSLWMLFALAVLGCSSAPKRSASNAMAIEESALKLQNDLASVRESVREDLRTIIREELMPEIKGLSYVPSEIRENQIKAKNSAIEKIVIGRVEWIKISSNNMYLKARVDSGAQTSSLHAQNIVEEEVDGKKYVQFESYDYQGEKKVFLSEVLKRSRVRSSNGELTRRYVIKMKIMLGQNEHEIAVNLNDREDLEYNFLIGRNLLMGNYVVDVSQSRLLGRP